MRQSRIYSSQPLSSTKTVELTGQAGHYLTRVLRLSSGDGVILFNGDGRDYTGKILGIQRQCVKVRLEESRPVRNESPLKITLVQAISRGERMDYSLQKATELGVSCIQPVSSSRVEVRLDEKRRAKRLAHWQGVVISACEQSGRAVVPEVLPPCTLEEWLSVADLSPGVVLDPEAEMKLSAFSVGAQDVSVLIGPEGGFTRSELEDVKARGITAVSLGSRVLRTETAGPTAIAVLQTVAGDL
jgi:16S rRNA (uracil1498-N3)-methyltransferase